MSRAASIGQHPSKALVTLAIGKRFRDRWNLICRDNWQAYADRHGYDLICIEDPLDDSERARARSPAWQKCLILSQPFVGEYERVVWLDSDILINPDAPDVGAGLPKGRVGAVDEFASPTREDYRRILGKLYEYWEAHSIPFVRNETPEAYYSASGLTPSFQSVVQTGVLVLSPEHHRTILESVYSSYEETRGPEWNYEMRPLSYELLKADAVTWLDPRFNAIWGSYKMSEFPFLLDHPGHDRAAECVGRALQKVYFLHFAGSANEMPSAAAMSFQEGLHAPARQEKPGLVSQRKRWRVEAPIVLTIFNRPDTTAKVMEAIRRAEPSELLIVADGPRVGDAGDAERCNEARRVAGLVDWDCHVLTNFSETNLGLRRRMQTGLDWVFEKVESAIILEDDCLPDATFFRFCDEMLERYRDEERILSVSGTNLQFGRRYSEESYYFSRYPLIWGWATWRRAWHLYDGEMAEWPKLRETLWLRDMHERDAARYWSYLFQKTWEGLNTWDYQLVLAAWRHHCLSIVPATNLVSNLGFRSDATHRSHDIGLQYSEIPLEPMTFPLIHHKGIVREAAADDFLEDSLFSGNLKRLLQRVHRRVKRVASAG